MRKLAKARLPLALSLCLTASQLWAQDLALPQGARLLTQQTTSPDSYALPTGPHDGTSLPAETVEGRVVREVWRIDSQSLTPLQIVEPLRNGLEQQNYDILLDCAELDCGGFDFRFATEVLPAPDMFVNLSNYRFLSARSDDGALGILVSGNASTRFVQVIRVGAAARREIKATAAPAAPVIVGDLAETLESAGSVVLDDVRFETGSTTLSDGKYETLEALASYLKLNPGRKVALVGHTDAVGGLNGNISISRRRAEAVLERLVASFGVPRSQLEAGGMGYLAPRASNLTPDGREANRRVEAVLTSTE